MTDVVPDEGVVPRFVGPWSVLGACLGVAAWLPAVEGGIPSWWAALGLPLVGVAMLLGPVGVVRQVGAGLATWVLVWPLVAASALVALGIGG